MKPLLMIGIALLTTLGATRAVPEPPDRPKYGSYSNLTLAGDVLPLDRTSAATAADDDDLWKKSIERGTKLLQGMKSNDKEAATLYGMGGSAESPFDGDLKDKLKEWGYNDNTEAMQKTVDKECNFDSSSGHMLKKAFTDLGLDTKSKGQKGPNQCFQIEHYDSPAVELDGIGEMPAKPNQRYKVCGKEYKITSGEHTIGANAEGGAVFAMLITSPASAARRLWKRAALPEELPHIRSVSDISWAFCAGGDVKNIKYFFVTMIINKETNKHVKRALSTLTPPKEEADAWPGTEFSMDTDAGKALLGSPVGRWAGYFLMQHKRQLGGNKYIDKMRVFKSEKEGSLPYFLFYVQGPKVTLEDSSVLGWSGGLSGGGARLGISEQPRIVKRSEDGRSIIREHIVRATL